MDLNPDFSDMLRCLNAHHVEYLVVGSFALAMHGRVGGEMGGHLTHFLGVREFIANKKATGRPKDLGDIDSLG